MRRAGPRTALVIGLALSVLVAAGGVVACGTASPAGAIVTVDAAHPGEVFPSNYLGLSFEASVLGSPLFDPARTNLPALLQNLGVGHLRFGGFSLDHRTAWLADAATATPPWAVATVTPDSLRRLGALSASTGWRIDLGVNLGHPDPTGAAIEVAAASRLIGAGLEAAEIGNEPDLFQHEPILRPGGYTYGDYLAEVASYRAAIATAVPGVGVAGPDTAGSGWLASYGRDEGAGLSFLTQHFYPLTRCLGSRPTIADLSSDATTRRETEAADAAVGAARASGLPVRFDETNSASCGGQDGVSNTLASALWLVRYLLLLAGHGVAGVDVQGGLAACRGYTPLCVPGATGASPGTAPGVDPVADTSLGAGPPDSTRLATQPDYYALLLVHLLEGGRWLPVQARGSTTVAAFALRLGDGTTRVVLVNPDPKFAATITIRGVRGGPTLLRLTGPSIDATTGISFGGSSVQADGSWRPAGGPAAAAGAPIALPAASAALVTFPAG